MNIDDIQRLIDGLSCPLPEWDFSNFRFGETRVAYDLGMIPDLQSDSLRTVLGLDDDTYRRIFLPDNCRREYGVGYGGVTPAMVADKLRDLIRPERKYTVCLDERQIAVITEALEAANASLNILRAGLSAGWQT
jgi:hypothetical protein